MLSLMVGEPEGEGSESHVLVRNLGDYAGRSLPFIVACRPILLAISSFRHVFE